MHVLKFKLSGKSTRNILSIAGIFFQLLQRNSAIRNHCTNVQTGCAQEQDNRTWEDTRTLDRSRYISIPEGEGQFVPVICRVHGDSLTVIQSLATLSSLPTSLFLYLPFLLSFSLSLYCSSSPLIRILLPAYVHLRRRPPGKPRQSSLSLGQSCVTEWRLHRLLDSVS